MYFLLALQQYWIWFLVALAISLIGNSTGYGEQSFWIVAIMFFVVVARRTDGHSVIREARIAYRTGQLEKATELWEKAIRQYPDWSDMYVSAATTYLAAEQPKRAIELCDVALSLKKKNPYAFYCRAVASMSMGYVDKGIADATMSLDLRKDMYQAYVARAGGYVMNQQYAKALDDVNTVIDRHGAFESAVSMRASALASMNKLDQALEGCHRSLDLCADKRRLPRLYVLRASVYAKRREVERAIEDCGKALELDVKCSSALSKRAYCYWLSKQYNSALADLEVLAAIGRSGKEKAWMLGNRARVRAAMGEITAALDDANAAVELVPAASPILATRGYVLFCAGKNQAALADVSKAIELDPYCVEAYWFRHQIYECLGESIKAQADKKAALEFGYKECD